MDWNKLLIVKGFKYIVDLIHKIDNTFLKGSVRIVVVIVVLWYVLYVWLWGFFSGYWMKSLITLGAWLLMEFINLVGGHSEQ